MTTRFTFSVAATDGAARTGVIAMQRGDIRTPAFMPVGTAATVKAMRPADVRATGADIILGNTYHLMLRPGAERMARLGGLHKFMGWDRPILTDSGGYQVMSLSALTKQSEEGVAFQSHLDGSRHMLTPERSMEIQRLLGSDIVMAFDECPPNGVDARRAEASMERSMRWAARSRAGFDAGEEHAARSALFGIQQGSLDETLRARSAAALTDIGFDGYAIGGLAVGEGQEAMFGVLDYAPSQLPADRPRYLMGVGKPDDLVGAVARGVDMFDCVLPTRSGRNGQAFTWSGPVNIRNAKHAEDQAPLDEACGCPVCSTWTRAYLHHLVRAGEMLGAMLMTQHNLHFYQDLMQGMHDAITEGRFAAFQSDFESRYQRGKAG
ncbi:tRNA guanosine(34) transglycosylase Tgt [Sphingopyxis sp. OPL5]|uniref:tRNA guanosine(34) transglycosylase Tgt n=1 Tax=Sphingopyxis sp. OPL5 TaxID=2486273 RepID=UPI00164D61C0|nr:tRNA guanosine(34) transglycosylase Tgt [Sphingopyxis sp. OPL5]QNO28586.1 tRNA guanosine(34) transglycosylase Tgt [Sphingopyxis sp. OPL5]